MEQASGVEQVPPFAIRRDRLEALLDRVPPGGLGVVVAGAGSGKSVVLAQWVASHPETCVASIVLSERHNDAMVLGASLLDALDRVELHLDPSLRSHLVSGRAALGASFFDELVDELTSLPHDLVIVLDDAHRLTDVELLADLDHFIDQLPANVRVVLAARWDPQLGLRRLRMGGRLVEMRAAELAFDPAEAGRMVRSVSGYDLDDEQAQELVDRTDGWAVGLQLAGISLGAAADPGRFIHDFAGTDRLVVEYLTEEVLEQLDDDTRTFLLQTSVLPWLTAELCAEVTGRVDARTAVRSLADRSLFVISLDRSDTRFRYHHLFSELMVSEATNELGADEVRRLRLAAAGWFRRHGHVHEAMEELLDAGAWPEAIDLVSDVGPEILQRGQPSTLVEWLSRIDAQQPEVPAAVLVNLLAAQLSAGQFLAGADTYRRVRRRGDTTRGEDVAADAMYVCCCLDGLPADEVIETAARVLSELSDARTGELELPELLGIGGSDTLETIVAYMLALAHFHKGELATAADIFEWVRTLPGMQFSTWRVYVLGALALVRAWRGELDEAQRLGSAAIDTATEAGAPNHVAIGGARLALGLVAIQRNDPTVAAVQLGMDGHPAISLHGGAAHDLRALLVARVVALTEGADVASEHLKEPARCAVPPELFDRAARALRAQLQLAAGDVSAARLTLRSGASDPESYPVRFDLDLAAAGTTVARATLARWRPDPSDPLDTVCFAIRRAVLLDSDGETDVATSLIVEVAEMAEADGLVRPFLDCPAVLPLIEAVRRRDELPFLERVVDADRVARSRAPGQSELIEPLTERELAVLALLPTRLTNAAIGRDLFMSVNTVKTHLRNIYRKLEVGDRDDAVARARSLGML